MGLFAVAHCRPQTPNKRASRQSGKEQVDTPSIASSSYTHMIRSQWHFPSFPFSSHCHSYFCQSHPFLIITLFFLFFSRTQGILQKEAWSCSKSHHKFSPYSFLLLLLHSLSVSSVFSFMSYPLAGTLANFFVSLHTSCIIVTFLNFPMYLPPMDRLITDESHVSQHTAPGGYQVGWFSKWRLYLYPYLYLYLYLYLSIYIYACTFKMTFEGGDGKLPNDITTINSLSSSSIGNGSSSSAGNERSHLFAAGQV
jgi:hypothetical protein